VKKILLRVFAALSMSLTVTGLAGVLQAWDKPGKYPQELTNSLGMKMALIPAGEFLMGSPADEKERDPKEVPQRKVEIPQPFYMGITEVTQGQWKAIMDVNPSFFKGSDDLPVDTVTWDANQEFLKKLSEKEGKIYRLPTSAEWEYACRAGTATAYYFGEDKTKLGEYAWYGANSDGKTHPVGHKKPNAWGLYDMCGNVWEWCQDIYREEKVGTAENHGKKHVLRGGSWHLWSNQPVCRSAYIYVHAEKDLHNYHGFRVVLTIDSKKTDQPQ